MIPVNNKIVDKKISIQIRIDRGLHKLLDSVAKQRHQSIKSLAEGYIAEGLKDETIQNY